MSSAITTEQRLNMPLDTLVSLSRKEKKKMHQAKLGQKHEKQQAGTQQTKSEKRGKKGLKNSKQQQKQQQAASLVQRSQEQRAVGKAARAAVVAQRRGLAPSDGATGGSASQVRQAASRAVARARLRLRGAGDRATPAGRLQVVQLVQKKAKAIKQQQQQQQQAQPKHRTPQHAAPQATPVGLKVTVFNDRAAGAAPATRPSPAARPSPLARPVAAAASPAFSQASARRPRGLRVGGVRVSGMVADVEPKQRAVLRGVVGGVTKPHKARSQLQQRAVYVVQQQQQQQQQQQRQKQQPQPQRRLSDKFAALDRRVTVARPAGRQAIRLH